MPKKKKRAKAAARVAVVVRLRPEVRDALRQAGLARRLKTGGGQQDIVEELLERWLRRKGYLAP